MNEMALDVFERMRRRSSHRQSELRISPGNCIGHNIKVFKILGYSGHYKSFVLSEKRGNSGEENLKSCA